MTTNVVAEGKNVTVTIKYGKAYEETWAVFRGTVAEIREMILEYFGIEIQIVEHLTTHELVVNVTNLAHGTGNAAAILGAVVIPASEGGVKAVQSETGNPWAGLGEGTAEGAVKATPAASTVSAHQHVIDAFAKATDVKELQKVWAANQSAFSDEAVVTAYKARGKELNGK